MSCSVIMLTGLAHSGKDTSADYLISRFTQLGIKCIKLGLADRLKIISQHLIKLFYGIEVPLDEFYDMNAKERIREDYPKFNGQAFKLRNVMQMVGSEIFRDLMWGTIWCDYVYKNFIMTQTYQIIIISDCRFLDELQYFDTMVNTKIITNTYTARIVRPNRIPLDATNALHQSERDIMNLPVQNNILNDSSIEMLYEQLEHIFVKCLIPY